MKNLLLISIIFLTLTNQAYAIGLDYSNYSDGGLLYSNSSFPQSVGMVGTGENIEIEDLSKLKKGESRTVNILNIVEKGDAGIKEAMQDGNITKIHYVDKKVDKVYIPIGFIPFYLKEKRTIVYGE